MNTTITIRRHSDDKIVYRAQTADDMDLKYLWAGFEKYFGVKDKYSVKITDEFGAVLQSNGIFRYE